MEKTNGKLAEKLSESGVLLAIGIALSYALPFGGMWPQGGSVTICSTLPIVWLSYKYGVKWGLLSGFTHALLKIAIGGLAEVLGWGMTVPAVVGSMFLDYVVAFSIIGIAGIFRGKFNNNRPLEIGLGCILGLTLRFVSHFIAGCLLYSSWAWEGWSVPTYSAAYNSGYMGPEIILTTTAAVILVNLPAFKSNLD